MCKPGGVHSISSEQFAHYLLCISSTQLCILFNHPFKLCCLRKLLKWKSIGWLEWGAVGPWGLWHMSTKIIDCPIAQSTRHVLVLPRHKFCVWLFTLWASLRGIICILVSITHPKACVGGLKVCVWASSIFLKKMDWAKGRQEKTDFLLVWGRYFLAIETGIKFVQGWYYLRVLYQCCADLSFFLREPLVWFWH